MPAQNSNRPRRLVRTTTLVWIVLLLAAAPRVHGGTVLVLYPDAPPPYQQAFEQMIGGLKRAVNQSLETLPLPGHYDIATIERWIEAHQKGDTTLVLLGQRALDAYAQLSIRLPAFVGGVSRLDDKTELPGISLTIAAFDGEAISIAILPLTYWRTNLHTLTVGAPMNVEADVLVKLAAMQMQAKKSEFDLTAEWLVANGY